MSPFVRISGCLLFAILAAGLGYERVVNAGGAQKQTSSDVAEVLTDDSASDPALSGSDTAALESTETIALLEVPVPPNYETLFFDREEVTLDAPLPETSDIAEDAPFASDPELLSMEAAATVPPSETDESIFNEITAEENIPLPEQGSAISVTETASQTPDALIVSERPASGGKTAIINLNNETRSRYDSLENQLSFPYEKIADSNIERKSEPKYPAKCSNNAQDEEFVIVRFAINSRGWTVRPEVAQSTNDCFNAAALVAARRTRLTLKGDNDEDLPDAGNFIISYIFETPGEARRYE